MRIILSYWVCSFHAAHVLLSKAVVVACVVYLVPALHNPSLHHVALSLSLLHPCACVHHSIFLLFLPSPGGNICYKREFATDGRSLESTKDRVCGEMFFWGDAAASAASGKLLSSMMRARTSLDSVEEERHDLVLGEREGETNDQSFEPEDFSPLTCSLSLLRMQPPFQLYTTNTTTKYPSICCRLRSVCPSSPPFFALDPTGRGDLRNINSGNPINL